MQRYFRIFRMGLWFGGTIFGGLAAAYPAIRERVGDIGGITPEEVDGLYALAVFLPGPSFLNFWGAICARAGGLVGTVVGLIGLLIPAFTLVLLLPLLTHIAFVAARTEGALNGAVWGTAGLLLATGIDGLRKLQSNGLRVAAVAVLIALLLGVHPVVLLVMVIAWGVIAGHRLGIGKVAGPS